MIEPLSALEQRTRNAELRRMWEQSRDSWRRQLARQIERGVGGTTGTSNDEYRELIAVAQGHITALGALLDTRPNLPVAPPWECDGNGDHLPVASEPEAVTV